MMADACVFYLEVCGKKDNVEQFLSILKTKYNYEKGLFGEFGIHFFDIQDCFVDATWVENETKSFYASVKGECKRSICHCFSKKGAYEHFRKRGVSLSHSYGKEMVRSHGTNIEDICKKLDIKVEIYGEEPKMQEHIVCLPFSYKEENRPFLSLPWDQERYKTLESFNEKFKTAFTEDCYNEKSRCLEYGGFKEWVFEI